MAAKIRRNMIRYRPYSGINNAVLLQKRQFQSRYPDRPPGCQHCWNVGQCCEIVGGVPTGDCWNCGHMDDIA